MRPHLLLIGTGVREFREYLLRSIATGYRVHLFTTVEPTWELSYVTGWTVLPSTLDATAMTAAARQLPEPVDGVLCWDEARIQAAADVSAALGLPGPTPSAIARCRDKHLTRTALAAAGVPQPGSVLVSDVTEALAAAERIGYPVVLKPRALAASLGVVLVADADALRAQFDFAHDTTVPGAPHHDDSVLVEEYATGPEISVDAAVFAGDVQVLCVARKQLGYAPYFEEIGHTVDGADPLLTDADLLDILERAHVAIGMSEGVTHTEFRLTPTGPKIIEINGRIGGDLIPYLGLRATGMDPGLTAAAIACGHRPAPVQDRKLCGEVRFIYPDEPVVVTSVRFTAELPADSVETVVLAEAGHEYAPPPAGTLMGRIAYVTAIADAADDCTAAIETAVGSLLVEAAP
jgi:biotin carboxylase